MPVEAEIEAAADRAERAKRADWFEERVRELLPDLYGCALRLVRRPADAEDLVADTVARAWENLHRLREPEALRGWMLRILGNACVSRRRASAARPELEPLPEDGTEPVVEDFSLFERLHQPFLLWWANPEQAFLNRLLREDIERALCSLPEEMRTVIVLCDLQGFRYREIAETLEVPIGTVRSRLARARARLQRALWTQAVDAGLVAKSGPEHGHRAGADPTDMGGDE